MLPYPVRPRQVYRDQAILPAVELPHPMPLVRVRVVVAENSTNLYKLKVLFCDNHINSYYLLLTEYNYKMK
jgi:hypothetical protein